MKIEMQIPLADGRIVLYDPTSEKPAKNNELYSRNVVRLDAQGNAIWRIDVPLSEGNSLGECVDSANHIAIKDGNLEVYMFYGDIYLVEIETGHATFERHERW
jgi:hypothetical protein